MLDSIYLDTIEKHNQLIDDYFSDIENLCNDADLNSIFIDYAKHRSEHQNSGFNIFSLMSDKYYYENLHSDIIAAFLNKDGGHNEGQLFLSLFIDLLNEIIGKDSVRNFDIKSEEFNDAEISREKFNIDILIQDKKTGKAIIIENKINNAGDTHRQLPTYYSKIGKDKVVAIVYLPLDPVKIINKLDWTPQEVSEIEAKLITLPAFNRTHFDLYEGWLIPCINKAKNDDAKTILKQYSKLIQKIGGFTMDKKLFANFYDKATKDIGFYKTALSIKTFVDEMPIYRAQKLREDLQNDISPFSILVPDERGTVVKLKGYKLDGRKYSLDISCNNPEKYELQFWDEGYEESINGEKASNKFTAQIVSKLQKVKLWEGDKDDFVKSFLFPNDEIYLRDFITDLRNDLQNLQNTA